VAVKNKAEADFMPLNSSNLRSETTLPPCGVHTASSVCVIFERLAASLF
jgi:hypothetical protein